MTPSSPTTQMDHEEAPDLMHPADSGECRFMSRAELREYQEDRAAELAELIRPLASPMCNVRFDGVADWRYQFLVEHPQETFTVEIVFDEGGFIRNIRPRRSDDSAGIIPLPLPLNQLDLRLRNRSLADLGKP